MTDSLAGNSKLRLLDLAGNHGISREGWKAILKAVCDTSSIDGVMSSSHVLSDVGMGYTLCCPGMDEETLQRVFDSSKEKLQNMLGTDDASLLCAALRVNRNYLDNLVL